MTDQEIRLAFGEMTGQEMRTAKAVVAFFERRIEQLETENAELIVFKRLSDSQRIFDGLCRWRIPTKEEQQIFSERPDTIEQLETENAGLKAKLAEYERKKEGVE